MTDDSEDEASAPSGGQPYPLDAQRAKRFLHDLRDRPFIAIVTDDGNVRVYSKDIDASTALRTMREVLAAIDEEETSAH